MKEIDALSPSKKKWSITNKVVRTTVLIIIISFYLDVRVRGEGGEESCQ